jgi:hypothetical protein
MMTVYFTLGLGRSPKSSPKPPNPPSILGGRLGGNPKYLGDRASRLMYPPKLGDLPTLVTVYCSPQKTYCAQKADKAGLGLRWNGCKGDEAAAVTSRGVGLSENKD